MRAPRDFWLSVAGSALVHAAFFAWLWQWQWAGEALTPPRTIEVALMEEAPPVIPAARAGTLQEPPPPGPEESPPPAAKPKARPSPRPAPKAKPGVPPPKAPRPVPAAAPDPLPGAMEEKPEDIAPGTPAGPAAEDAPASGGAGAGSAEAPLAIAGAGGGGDGPQGAPGSARGAGEAVGAGVSEAAYRRNPKPVYPKESRRRREEGAVRLAVLVGRDGTAREVRVEKGSGYPRLDEAALAAVRCWEFVPASRGGVPEDAWYSLTVTFRLKG